MPAPQKPDRPTPNAEVAIGLAAAGIPVFPAICTPSSGNAWSKRPLVAKWQSAATTDRAQIVRWWRQWPDAVPGIPLKGHVVIDADRHGGADGVAALQRLAAGHGGLPPGPVTETAGGGLHHVFRQPVGKALGNRRGALPEGIDVRGLGGWIVAPGSMRSDGKVWAPRPGTPSLGEAFKGGTIPEIPTWLVALIEARPQKPTLNGAAAAAARDYGPRAQRTLSLLCDEMRRTPEGSRNETLNRNGFRLASIVASGWLDQHQAVDELSAAALESGLPPDEVQTTLASGFAAGLKSPAAPPEDRPPSRTADHEAKKASGGGKPPRFNWREGAISAQALMAKVFPDTVYIVPGILPEGLTLLVGRPKVGKSWWALDLCLAVAGEGYFMGGIVPGIRGDVLYLALEDNQRRLQRRMKKLLGNAEVPERLTFHTRWRRANEGGIDDIREWCDEHPDAKLVVIDTLQTIRPLAGPDGYAKDYQAIEPLQKLAGERSISVVVLHHDRKADADDVFDTISGTLGLSGSSDAMLVLKRDPNVRFVLHGRGRDIEDFEKAMTFEKATCQWRMVGDAEEVKRSAQQRKILAAIGDAKVPVGPKEIATACRMKEDNVKFLLGKLAREGAVEKLDRGLYRLPAHPDQKGGER